jgi:hypothetical protein
LVVFIRRSVEVGSKVNKRQSPEAIENKLLKEVARPRGRS